MKKLYKQISAALLTVVVSGSVMAKDELNIAYFLEWPSANQVAQVEKIYDEKMGMKVNWRSFDDGNAMTAAMVSGDIDIAYSQGFIPFVIGVTKGIDLKLIGVAMTYADNDNCVVHKDAKITKDNAKDLEGKKVATLTSGVSYYKMLKTLEYLKVDTKKVKVLSMSNADAAAALARGDVDMACGFGGALNRMKEYGKVLMTGAEQEAIGLKVFDIIATTGKFAKDHPKLVTQFMQITEDANLAYNKDPAKYYKTLAKASGMKEEGAIKTLNKFTFLDKSAQLSKDWMQGGVQSFTKEVADFFVKQKELPKALTQEAYDKAIDASFLEKVK
ncbi:MAG: ABC transporter substrate-binding protein [Cocleimonas sp.]|nr:ABC transporter substrate-binding protein [Cocleimonas sp.]